MRLEDCDLYDKDGIDGPGCTAYWLALMFIGAVLLAGFVWAVISLFQH